MNTVMMILLLSFVVVALTATALTIRAGGRGCAPRSHFQDERFIPPARIVH